MAYCAMVSSLDRENTRTAGDAPATWNVRRITASLSGSAYRNAAEKDASGV
jgi:hypothetical protein